MKNALLLFAALAFASSAPAQVWPELLRGEVSFIFPDRGNDPTPPRTIPAKTIKPTPSQPNHARRS